jgi:hypothetical protein
MRLFSVDLPQVFSAERMPNIVLITLPPEGKLSQLPSTARVPPSPQREGLIAKHNIVMAWSDMKKDLCITYVYCFKNFYGGKIMVKTFKKAIAVLICVLMVVTSLPFTAITAQAGTTTVANTLFEYTFDNGSLTDTTGSNALTVQGWNTGNNVANSDNYYFDDGGCYGAVSSSIKGLDNWKITYQGYSTQNLDSSKQSGSCEIGLGTASGNTNIVYVSSYGHIYSNGSLLETGSLNSASMNIIVLEYNNGSLTVTMNGTAYGPYSVDSSLFTNVSYLYTGVDSAISIGSHVHYVYDIKATTDVTVENDETYEVFGNVTIDPIVYIHGSDYMFYF